MKGTSVLLNLRHINIEFSTFSNVQVLYNHQLLPLNASTAEYDVAYEETQNKYGHNQTVKWGLSPNCTLEKQLGSAAEGTGLAFIVFTQAIVELPGAPFWAVLFFTMLLSLGIGSQIGILEGMLCTLFDIDIMKRLRKQYVTGECKLYVVELYCLMDKTL